jgi:hypothetical protein
VKCERKPSPVCNVDDTRAHPFQRVQHAPHWPAAQGFVAIESGRHRCARDRTDRQPSAGARIAKIKHASRLRKSPNPDAENTPGLVANALHVCAKGAHHVGGVQNVLAFQHACDRCLSDRKSPEDQSAVGNRFIARHPGPPLHRAGMAGGYRR